MTKLFRSLRTIARAAATALLETRGVELAAHDRVLHADVLHTSTAEEYHRVFLEVVRLARDVGGDFHTVREAYASDLADSRVRLAGSLRGYLGAHTTLKR